MLYSFSWNHKVFLKSSHEQMYKLFKLYNVSYSRSESTSFKVTATASAGLVITLNFSIWILKKPCSLKSSNIVLRDATASVVVWKISEKNKYKDIYTACYIFSSNKKLLFAHAHISMIKRLYKSNIPIDLYDY